MNVTFLVTIEVDEPSAAMLSTIAEELADDLASMGQAVVDVKPWDRPTLAAGPSILTPQPPAI